MSPWLTSWFGGTLIGLAASLMLVANGRVTGISGIFGGLLSFARKDMAWRVAFLGGLLLGGLTFVAVKPEALQNLSGRSPLVIALAGLFVGFGTTLGSGCTSGHGVCGISRMSLRSIVATALFMVFGFLTATVFFNFSGGQP